MKKVTCFLALMLSFVMSCGNYVVHATTMPYSIVPTSGTPSSTMHYAESSSRNNRAAIGISSYCDSILYDSKMLIFTGETTATHTATKIGNLQLRLQVWNGTDWQDISNDSYYRNNSILHTVMLTYTPTKGKHYRVAGIHLAIINGTTYTTTTNYSDYIYVSP